MHGFAARACLEELKQGTRAKKSHNGQNIRCTSRASMLLSGGLLCLCSSRQPRAATAPRRKGAHVTVTPTVTGALVTVMGVQADLHASRVLDAH